MTHAQFAARCWTARSFVTLLLLLCVTAGLIVELVSFASVWADWHPFDYEMYVHWGRLLWQGQLDHYYPLPTVFWIFAPLALLPDWFKYVFGFAPFGIVLWMFGRKGLIWWLYFPLLSQTQYAQLDGWLIIPLAWLIRDRPRLAPLGAVLLLTKPILAPFAVLYAVLRWVWLRQWRHVAWFSALLALYVLPAFIIDWAWPLHFIQQLPLRATHPYLAFRGVSIWTWWQYGGLSQILFPFLALVIIGLTVYLARRTQNLTAPVELLNLLAFPYLYEANLTLIIPLMQKWPEIALVVAASWVAVAFDILAAGWGGAYAIISLVAFTLLAHRVRLLSSDPPPHHKLRAEIEG